MGDDSDPIVFISCGQYSESERQLGQRLAALVTEHIPGVRGYFAQNESSLQALSQNILSALDRCVGFVAVIHPRGSVSNGSITSVRGSVWVEQEIAIASFLAQIYGKTFPIAVFIHSDVKVEGLRQLLQLNQTFTNDDEVEATFRALVSTNRFIPPRFPMPTTSVEDSPPYSAELNSDSDYFRETFMLPDHTGRFRLSVAPKIYNRNRLTREDARRLAPQTLVSCGGYSVPFSSGLDVSAFGEKEDVSRGVEGDWQNKARPYRRDALRLHCSGLYSLLTFLPGDFGEDGILRNDGTRELGFKQLVFESTLRALLARAVARSVLASETDVLVTQMELAGARGRKLVDDTNSFSPLIALYSARPCRESRIQKTYEGSLGSFEKDVGRFALEFIMEVLEMFNATMVSGEDVYNYQLRLVGQSEPIAFPVK